VLGVYDGSDQSLPSSGIGNRYLFQGREYSFETGLYNFRARYYDPQTGRWLSNDPIGISGGLNQYVFCANNPVMFGDPEGCFSQLEAFVPAGIIFSAGFRVMISHDFQVADAAMALSPGGEGVWISTAYTQLLDPLLRAMRAIGPMEISAVYVYVDCDHKVRVDWKRPHPSRTA
jgi:RHS repeat-associated protein